MSVFKDCRLQTNGRIVSFWMPSFVCSIPLSAQVSVVHMNKYGTFKLGLAFLGIFGFAMLEAVTIVFNVSVHK